MLLLGAGGFAGAHLRQAATEAGLRVVTSSRGGGGGAPACDLTEPASVAACVEAVRPDLVVNAAGSSSVARSWERPAEVFSVNATGVLNLLEAVSRHAADAHVLCLSSAAVYGEPLASAMPLAEEAPAEPVSPYGAGKLAMEELCAQYARARGLAIAVVRAFNLVGPGQPAFSAASGLARQVAAAERAGEPRVELALGNPGAARDTTDVRDAARALLEVSKRRLTGTYNLCSGVAPTVADLAATLAAATPLEVSTRVDPALARPADPPLLLGDPARLRDAAGFAPAIPLERSLADLLDWWRAELA
ncbi:MAG TPA: NAD-dependent epimerase/dehydratase family protein [Solirubrobacterales bacterium]|nr:NAD-dependent epimerase/dehydratase family protein [Solirubrobacterales bacterium]